VDRSRPRHRSRRLRTGCKTGAPELLQAADAAAVGIDDVGEVGVEVGAGPGGVGGVLGGGVPADAIMDRIVHNTIWIETGDVNMREHTATRGQLKPGR